MVSGRLYDLTIFWPRSRLIEASTQVTPSGGCAYRIRLGSMPNYELRAIRMTVISVSSRRSLSMRGLALCGAEEAGEERLLLTYQTGGPASMSSGSQRRRNSKNGTNGK